MSNGNDNRGPFNPNQSNYHSANNPWIDLELIKNESKLLICPQRIKMKQRLSFNNNTIKVCIEVINTDSSVTTLNLKQGLGYVL